jgi:hypothetical protein
MYVYVRTIRLHLTYVKSAPIRSQGHRFHHKEQVAQQSRILDNEVEDQGRRRGAAFTGLRTRTTRFTNGIE